MTAALTIGEATRPAEAYALDPLRDARHKQARAARECADWERSLAVRDLAPSTRYQYALTVWDLLEAFPGKLPPEFTTGDVEQLLVQYPAQGRPSRIAHLNSFFRYLRKRRLIAENPMEFMDMPRKRAVRLPATFTEAEVAILCDDSQDGRLMTLLFETGIRKAEACRLQRRHVNLSRGELAVLRGKGDKDRLVPLTERAKSAVADFDLIERLNPEDYFWYCRPSGGRVRRSQPVSSTAFAVWFDRVLAAAGIEKGARKPHSTRHTYATLWRRRGLALDELQLVLGHASVQTTSDLYVHTTAQDVARRMAEIEAGV